MEKTCVTIQVDCGCYQGLRAFLVNMRDVQDYLSRAGVTGLNMGTTAAFALAYLGRDIREGEAAKKIAEVIQNGYEE